MIKYTKCYYPLCEQCGYNDCVVKQPKKMMYRRRKALEDPEAYRAKQEEFNAYRREQTRIKNENKPKKSEEELQEIEKIRKETKKLNRQKYLQKIKNDPILSENKKQAQQNWKAKNKDRIREYNKNWYQQNKLKNIHKSD